MGLYEDRVWDELVEQHVSPYWSPAIHYEPGDVVSVEEYVPRRWWEWLLRRPRRTAVHRYICQSAQHDRWAPL